MVPAKRTTRKIRKSRAVAFCYSTQTSHWPDAFVQQFYDRDGNVFVPKGQGVRGPKNDAQIELVAGRADGRELFAEIESEMKAKESEKQKQGGCSIS